MFPRPTVFLGILLSTVVLITGCGIGTVDHSSSGTLAIQGVVFGGQQPVTDAKIQLYTVGVSGNASGATAMIPTGSVKTVAGGNFKITGDYTCGKTNAGLPVPAATDGIDNVYIVATDGNPGLLADNPKMVLMAALGDCSKLATTQFIEINEVTTAAAAWALAPFMTSATNVGASPTNSAGIFNAFLDAGLIADTSTGLATKFPADSNLAIETNKLYALANSIASCVNSDGGSACSPLFNAATSTGVPAPTDTLGAALNIVKHPGVNVANVYAAKSGFSPFPSKYTTAPNDWTMSLTVTGGGLDNPIALAIDQVGNVWVGGHDGPLSAFNPQGVPLSATGYGAGQIDKSNGMAIDRDGNIWITQYNDTIPGSHSGAVTKFLGVNAPAGMQGSAVLSNGYPGFTSEIYFPYGLAADLNGDIYVANWGNGSATVLATDGSVAEGEVGGNLTSGSFPETLAIDATNGFWLPTGGTNVDHISADGQTRISTTKCCETSWGVATDLYGDVWVADYEGQSFSEIGPDGTLLIDQSKVGGIYYPQYLAVDAAQNVWFANVLGDSITEIASNQTVTSTAVALSPSATPGVEESGGFGHDAGLSYVSYIAPDPSGNVWVTNANIDTVTMFFGLATPTLTPIQSLPTAP